MRHKHVRGELVRRIDDSAGSLKPWLKSLRARKKVPAKDHRRDADSSECPAANRHKIRIRWRAKIFVVWSRCVRLPEGHDIAAEFELAAQNARMHDGREELARLYAGREKPVVGAVAEPIPIKRERPVFPAAGCANFGRRVDGSFRFVTGRCARGLSIDQSTTCQNNQNKRTKLDRSNQPSSLLTNEFSNPQKGPPFPGGPFIACIGPAQPATCSICSASISKFEYTFCVSSKSSSASRRRIIWFAACPSSFV